MKPLDSNELKLCQLQAKIFESSINNTSYSSAIFIRRFMYSEFVKTIDDKTYLIQSNSIDDVFNMLDEEFGKTNYGDNKYSIDQMYWIGYIYRCFSIIYNLTSKQVYKLINAKQIIKYYNAYHTLDPVVAVNNIAEDIDYKNIDDINEVAKRYMKKLLIQDKLKDLIGKEVEVIVDRQIGSKHPDYPETEYNINYGYIKDIKAIDNEYQDAYIIGIKEPVLKYNGKVIGIIDRKNDYEDKLIVCDNNINYSNEEIKKEIDTIEKYFKYRIIR